MSFLPSPPSSPLLSAATEKAVCGSCDRELEIGWFCSQCHTKCSTCSRFLTDQDYCTRCWLYDSGQIRQKNNIISSPPFVASFQHFIPYSPTNSTSGHRSRQGEPILPLNLFTPPFVS